MQKKFLVRFAQAHESFRRPEVEAISRQLNVNVEIVEYSPSSPFSIICFHPLLNEKERGVVLNTGYRTNVGINDDSSVADSAFGSSALSASSVDGGDSRDENAEDLARKFASLSISSRGIYEVWGTGSTCAELHDDVRLHNTHLWGQYQAQTSFKFTIDCFGHTRSEVEKLGLINQFAYLDFKGKIDLRKPEQEFVVFEEWVRLDGGPSSEETENGLQLVDEGMVSNGTIPRKLNRVFLTRKIGLSRRSLIDKHDLKKRPYISTTSMDAELALVTANLALAAPGKLFLDPFVGTGGFMVAAAELGAMTLGSDIDGRSFRGKGKGQGVHVNFKKYGLMSLFGDCITSDLTNTPFRLRTDHGRWLDGIICDPPYGVREGLKVLGMRNPARSPKTSLPLEAIMVDGVPAHILPGYIAPKRPYSFERMLDDILEFSSQTLVDGGRLAFWMPSANEDEFGKEEVTEIPLHPLLDLKHECVQRFNKWSRRLLVYERIIGDEVDSNRRSGREEAATHIVNGATADELNPFRKRYFQAFENRPPI